MVSNKQPLSYLLTYRGLLVGTCIATCILGTPTSIIASTKRVRCILMYFKQANIQSHYIIKIANPQLWGQILNVSVGTFLLILFSKTIGPSCVHVRLTSLNCNFIPLVHTIIVSETLLYCKCFRYFYECLKVIAIAYNSKH